VASGAVRSSGPDDAGSSGGEQVESVGGDVTAIFLLICALLFAVSVAGMLWIRVAAAEYRHNWNLPQDNTRRNYRTR
jgi:hypothetical protein